MPPVSRAILVTGLPRSGTTYVGKVLDMDPVVSYVWEPLNSRFRAGVAHHYPYVGPSSPQAKRSQYRKLLSDTIALRNLRPALGRAARNPGQLGLILKVARGWRNVARRQRKAGDGGEGTLVIKDPVGFFLSGLVAADGESRVVIVVRHPMALLGAWKSLGWQHDFRAWFSQSDFRADRLDPYRAWLDDAKKDPIVHIALLWRVAYEYAVELEEQMPDRVRLVRHEDACINPLGAFREIYRFCGLELRDNVAREVELLTAGGRVDRRSRDLSRLEQRDASRLAERWKTGADPGDLGRLRALTSNAAERIYPEEQWWTIDKK